MSSTDLYRNPTPVEISLASAAQLQREYVAGGQAPYLATLRRSLPQYVDDVTRDFGIDLYEEMMRDSDVSSSVDIIKSKVLGDGFRIVPAVEKPVNGKVVTSSEQADVDKSEYWVEFCERRLEDMETPFHEVCWELLDGPFEGHKVAEKIGVIVKSGVDAGKFGWRAIKTRPRKYYAFVVDVFYNVVGYIAIQPGKGVTALPSFDLIGSPTDVTPWFMPADKFICFRGKIRNSDPRGFPDLRPAYNPYFMKGQTLISYYNYLRRFATPIMIGLTPEQAEELTPAVDPTTGNQLRNPDGTFKLITKEEAMKNAMLTLEEGGVACFPFGSEVIPISPVGDGQAFLHAFGFYGNQIAQAVLKTSRTNQVATRSSQSDSDNAMDVTEKYVLTLKHKLAECLTESLLRPLIKNNSSDPHDMDLCPSIQFTPTESADTAVLVTAAAQAGYTFHSSQFPGLDRKFDMPDRDLEQIAQEKKQEADLQSQQVQAMSTLYGPSGRPSPNPSLPAPQPGKSSQPPTAAPTPNEDV